MAKTKLNPDLGALKASDIPFTPIERTKFREYKKADNKVPWFPFDELEPNQHLIIGFPSGVEGELKLLIVTDGFNLLECQYFSDARYFVDIVS